MLEDFISENTIFVKFGDMRKGYRFTKVFEETYKFFSQEFHEFFHFKESYFKNPYQILDYIDQKEIPVFFFFDFDGRLSNNINTVREYIEDYGTYIKTDSAVVEIVKDYGTNIKVKVNLVENYRCFDIKKKGSSLTIEPDDNYRIFVKIQKIEGIENLEIAKKMIDEYWDKKEEENKYSNYTGEMLRKRAKEIELNKLKVNK